MFGAIRKVIKYFAEGAEPLTEEEIARTVAAEDSVFPVMKFSAF